MRTYNTNIRPSKGGQPLSISSDAVISSDVEALAEMLRDALDDEYRDYNKYMTLSSQMDDLADSETVKSLAYDEYKHRRLFEEIYAALTGSAPLPPENIPAYKPEGSLTDEFTNSLFGELEAVELYRDIMSSIENLSVRDMIFEIITDEQSHADIINYLLSKLNVKQLL